MASPEYLYRGTPRIDVDQFTPKEMVGGKLVVSASSDRTTALKFVVPIEDLKVKLGTLENTHYYICADEVKFRKMDKGGAIYTLPPDGFDPAPQVGTDVWVNKNPVIPINKEIVPSALKAMIGAGVQVYFVSEDTFERFRDLPEERQEILKSFVSENLKQENH